MANPAELSVEMQDIGAKGLKSRFAAATGGVFFIACSFGAVALATSSSDAMISAGFDRAIARASVPAIGPLDKAAPGKTEEEWLRVSDADPALIKTAAVGQQLRLISPGADRTVRITDVTDLGEATTHINTSSEPAHVLLVTCREGDASTGTEYRIRIEGGYVRDVTVTQHAHAL